MHCRKVNYHSCQYLLEYEVMVTIHYDNILKSLQINYNITTDKCYNVYHCEENCV